MDCDRYARIAASTVHDVVKKMERVSELGEFNLSLIGMSGEFGQLLHHQRQFVCYGDPISKEAVVRCLGGILWYLTRAASSVGSSLPEVVEDNVKRIKEKYPEHFDSPDVA